MVQIRQPDFVITTDTIHYSQENIRIQVIHLGSAQAIFTDTEFQEREFSNCLCNPDAVLSLTVEKAEAKGEYPG
jgi:hypothetical protein